MFYHFLLQIYAIKKFAIELDFVKPKMLQVNQMLSSSEVTPPQKWTHGKAVVNGKIRFLSASQIVAFDPRQPGGCPRRWAFQKLFGKKEEVTDALRKGDVWTKELEHYLKTGVNVLSPVLRAAQHLFPKPGPDIESEVQLARDFKKAVELRDQMLRGDTSDYTHARLLDVATITANGIPFSGAADFRHRRGVHVDEDGVLKLEPPHTVEIGDLKTTSRISSFTARNGTVYQGYAKTVDQVVRNVQMLLYGAHSLNLYPGTEHVRLSHVYAQSKNGLSAKKVTGLVSAEVVKERWRGVVEIVKEMEQVAEIGREESDADKIDYNLQACNSYNRLCTHAPYCNRPAPTVVQLLQIKLPTYKGEQMSNGLFDTFGAPPPTNGVHTPRAAAPPVLPQSEIARAAEIEAEKQKLLGNYEAAKEAERVKVIMGGGVQGQQVCNTCRVQLTVENSSRLQNGHVVHVGCPGNIAAINPPDAPPFDLRNAAAPLSAEIIATIADPELKERATAHAAAVAEMAPANDAKPTKESGRCIGGGKTISLSRAQAAKGKMDCPMCNKDVKLKVSDDFETGVVAMHNRPKAEAIETPVSTVTMPISGIEGHSDATITRPLFGTPLPPVVSLPNFTEQGTTRDIQSIPFVATIPLRPELEILSSAAPSIPPLPNPTFANAEPLSTGAAAKLPFIGPGGVFKEMPAGSDSSKHFKVELTSPYVGEHYVDPTYQVGSALESIAGSLKEIVSLLKTK